MIKIDWAERFSNHPRIIVEDDLALLPREECRFEFKDGIFYHVQDNGLVRYFAHSGSDVNEGGFGGARFDILDADGNPKTLQGPWSSRASYVNMVTGLNVADITLNNGRGFPMHIGILADKLAEMWDVDAFLIRGRRSEDGVGEQDSFTASLDADRIRKPNGMVLDTARYGYEVFAEPVKQEA